MKRSIKILLFTFHFLLFTFYFASAQVTTKIIGDTIKMYQTGVSGNAELKLMNNTRTKTGAFLQNIGNGITKFNYAIDSVWEELGQLKFRRGTDEIAFNLSGLFDAIDTLYVRNDSLFYQNGDEFFVGVLAGSEATSAINLTGTGIGLFKTESGDELQFKRLKNAYAISIEDATDSVLLSLDTAITDLRYLRNTIRCGLTAGPPSSVVVWSGTGLTFDVAESFHNHDYVSYYTPAGSITLDAADGTFDRFDAIGLTTSGLAKITGTASSDPQLPQFDPCEFILLTYVFVQAGATTPVQVSDELIYNEDAETWTHATAGTISANFASTVTSSVGTKSIALASWSNNSNIIFTAPGALNANNYNTFSYYIKLTTAMASNVNISVQFFNGTTAVSNLVVSPFTKSYTSSFQGAVFSMSQFTFTSNTFTAIKLIFNGSNANNVYIDFIRLQGGVTQPPVPVGLQTAYARITDGSNTATSIGSDIFKIRTNNTLSAVVTNNDATHGDNVLLGINLSNANTWAADQSVPDEAYDATNWNGSVEVPTKNAIRDKIESLSAGNVTKVGTPVDNQIGIWTGDGTMEGVSDLTFDGVELRIGGFLDLNVTGNIYATNGYVRSGWLELVEAGAFGSVTSGMGVLWVKNDGTLHFKNDANVDIQLGAGGGGALDDLTDVIISSVASGDLLRYNGSSWVNVATIGNSNLTNSTISGISLGSNLADLTATNSTLTFSGSYNGGTARTVGINLSNANTWAADQSVPDEAYDATAWNGSVEVPTKNAIRDKIEALGAFSFSRNMITAIAIGTDANITAAAGTAYHLPAATLSTGRTINVTNLNTDGDYVEFYNNEEGFLWSFTGATVYDSDGATAVTELLINANSVIRVINGKRMISKL